MFCLCFCGCAFSGSVTQAVRDKASKVQLSLERAANPAEAASSSAPSSSSNAAHSSSILDFGDESDGTVCPPRDF